MRDALGSVQSVLVLGGGSDIGLAIARRLAPARHARVVLAGRSPDAMAAGAEALKAAGAGEVAVEPFDARDASGHAQWMAHVFERYGGFDVVVVAFGLLGSQELAENDAEHAVELADTNYVGAMSATIEAGRMLAVQGHGAIVVLSSVAGERPRRSNFVYGSTKAAIDAFALGFAEAQREHGVHVLVVRPGFVRSKMTAGMETKPMSTTPDEVAAVVARGLERRARVVWAPPALRFVMMILRHLPQAVFRRLPL